MKWMLPLAVGTSNPIKVSHYPLVSACSQSQSSIFTSVQWAYGRSGGLCGPFPAVLSILMLISEMLQLKASPWGSLT